MASSGHTHDISKIRGPGTWQCLHIMGIRAVTDPLFDAFIINSRAIIEEFACAPCSQHAKDWADKNPIEKYRNIRLPTGEKIGAFLWTYQLHNHANSNTKLPDGTFVPPLDWDVAYNAFKNPSSFCTSDCGGSSDNKKEEIKSIPIAQTTTIRTNREPPKLNQVTPAAGSFLSSSSSSKPLSFRVIRDN